MFSNNNNNNSNANNLTIITQLCAVWHQRGDVLQGGDGEGWHGTSPGADQDEEGERGGEDGLMW